MRRTIPLLTTMALTLLVASGVALAAGIGSAAAESSVVGPGESTQKAINAADPGDTIAVHGGTHRESVRVKKDGISLRGVDAVLKPPAKPTSSPSCGVSGFCVKADEVSISGFTVRNFKDFGIVALGARNARFVANSAFNNGEYGITAFSSTGTQIVSNLTSGSDLAGIYVGDSPHADATVPPTKPTTTSWASWCAMPSTARSPATGSTTTAKGYSSWPTNRAPRVTST